MAEPAPPLQPAPVAPEPPPVPNDSFTDPAGNSDLDSLSERLSRRVANSPEVRSQVQQEVDRAFRGTMYLLNFLIVVVILFPISILTVVFFLRRSIVNQIAAEVQSQLELEYAEEPETDVPQLESSASNGVLMTAPTETVDRLKETVSMALAAQNIVSEARSTIAESLEFQNKLAGHLQALCQYYSNQAGELCQAQRYEEALALYEKAIEIEDSSYEVWCRCGAVLAKLERYPEAIAAYDKATMLEPQAVEIWYERGLLLTRMAQYQEALASFDKAATLQPDNYKISSDRSVPLMRLGRYQEALHSLEQALATHPTDASSHYYKARLFALQGNAELAAASLKQAIDLDPDNRDRARADADFSTVRGDTLFHNLVSV
ncbi:MAG: tetratricopeptide repeat protein [Coleofasciculaceae cyanobacterium SM2_3_26]|nr:tetratricopeptide repeat protein [Coleofasciculaceae cyanobacterium SM2_3_26]